MSEEIGIDNTSITLGENEEIKEKNVVKSGEEVTLHVNLSNDSPKQEAKTNGTAVIHPTCVNGMKDDLKKYAVTKKVDSKIHF